MLKIEGISWAPVRKILSFWEGMRNFYRFTGSIVTSLRSIKYLRFRSIYSIVVNQTRFTGVEEVVAQGELTEDGHAIGGAEAHRFGNPIASGPGAFLHGVAGGLWQTTGRVTTHSTRGRATDGERVRSSWRWLAG